MDSHLASFIKTAIAIIFWPLALGVFIVTWQLSQTQNFQQYASGVIAREGGLTKNAIEQIDKESLNHYRGVFRVTNADKKFVTYTGNTDENGKPVEKGSYRGGMEASAMKIKPYGSSIKYHIQAQPTAFRDIPVIRGVGNAIKIDNVWSTTALNRNAGAIAQDDTNVIDDTDPNSKIILPQNTTIQLNLSEFSSKPKNFALSKVLKVNGELTNVEVVDDNRDETVAVVDKVNNVWSIKPLKKGSTSVQLKLKVKDSTGDIKSMTRTYVIVIL